MAKTKSIKGFYKSWGYSEKPCFVCGDKKKQNQSVQPSDRSFTGVLCPKCLFERIERMTADDDADRGKEVKDDKEADGRNDSANPRRTQSAA